MNLPAYSELRTRDSFARAQRAYDNMTPPDEDPTLTCAQCGAEFAPERPGQMRCEGCEKESENE